MSRMRLNCNEKSPSSLMLKSGKTKKQAGDWPSRSLTTWPLEYVLPSRRRVAGGGAGGGRGCDWGCCVGMEEEEDVLNAEDAIGPAAALGEAEDDADAEGEEWSVD